MFLELISWLAGRVAWLTLGENIWAGHVPLKTASGAEIPIRVAALLDGPSVTEPDLEDRFDQHVQLWNRSEDYFDGLDDAMSIYDEIHANEDISLPVLVSGQAFRIWTMEAMGRPRSLEAPDARGPFTFTTDFMLRLAKA